MSAIHKTIRGEGAGKWLPFARAKLARLAAECERARAAHRTRRFVVDAGMVDVAVAVKGGQHYITIERRPCPPFLSGFTDAVLHTFPSVRSPVWQIPDPDDSEATINVFRRFYPSPATPAEDRAWRDEPGLARYQDAADQLLALKASMYSGEMRQVVQVLQGMNVEIPYLPYFSPGTHGIFVSASGQRWIIEVSPYGTFAWPMTMCRNPVVGEDGAEFLSYTPISTPKPVDTQEARDAGRIFELIDQPTMQEFYVHAPMSPYCGWAFSEDGHKAANVCWDKFGGFEHVHTYLFEITIVEEGGRPATATLTQVDTGIYHGDRVYTQVKFPKITGSLYSFDPLYGVHNQVVSNAPIYTYYDAATRIDVYYESDPYAGGTQVFSDSFQDSCGNTNLGRMGREYKSGSIIYDPTPRVRITGLGNLPAAVVGGTVAYKIERLPPAVGQHTHAAEFGAGQIKDVYGMVSEVGSRTSLARHFYAFVVPYGEREAFYLARRHENTNTYASRDVSVSPVTVEPFYERVHVCSCGGTGPSQSPLEPVIMARGQPQPIQLMCDGAPGIVFLGNGGPYLPGGYNGAIQTSFQLSGNPAFCGEPGDNPGNCGQIPGVYSQVCPGVGACMQASFPGQVEATASFSVEFHGSGGARAVFHPDEYQDDWFFFLEPDQAQFVVAQRDAFVPSKMLVSPQIDALEGPDLYSTADDYPVSEAGQFFNLNLIGVP